MVLSQINYVSCQISHGSVVAYCACYSYVLSVCCFIPVCIEMLARTKVTKLCIIFFLRIPDRMSELVVGNEESSSAHRNKVDRKLIKLITLISTARRYLLGLKNVIKINFLLKIEWNFFFIQMQMLNIYKNMIMYIEM